MKPALTTLMFIALAASSAAWDHPVDPLEKVVVRFKEQHPQHCKEVVDEVLQRLSGKARARQEMRIEGLSRLMGNMRAGVRTVQHNLERRDDTAVRHALLQLSTELHSFRRVLDQLVIETAASNDIALDEQLMAKLRSLWNKEESFAFRFGSEAVELKKLEELRSRRWGTHPEEPKGGSNRQDR
jgi:hypothetical protein